MSRTVGIITNNAKHVFQRSVIAGMREIARGQDLNVKVNALEEGPLNWSGMDAVVVVANAVSDAQIEMIRAAHELELLTTPYVFAEEDAQAMARAGADIIVCHLGLTTGGAIGAETALTLDACVPKVNAWAKAAKAVNPEVIVLCHGGPIAMPADATYILKNCSECHGFYGASSMERLPTEVALTEQTRKFKSISR